MISTPISVSNHIFLYFLLVGTVVLSEDKPAAIARVGADGRLPVALTALG